MIDHDNLCTLEKWEIIIERRSGDLIHFDNYQQQPGRPRRSAPFLLFFRERKFIM